MNSEQTKLLSVFFSTIVLLSMLAVPVMGTGLSSGDDTAVTGQADAQDGTSVTISQTVQDSEGTQRLVLRFGASDGAVAPTSVESMKSQARDHHEQVRRLASSTDDLDVVYTSWLADAALVEVDTDSETYRKLQRLEGLTQIHSNFQVDVPEQPVSKDVAEPTQTNTTYGLEQIDAVEAWNEFDTRGEGAKVAVLDTGVDAAHQDLDLYTENASDPTYPGGWAEFNGSGSELDTAPRDDAQHGTHTSGTVSAGNASGQYVGVAPEVDLMHGMVLGNSGGTFTAVVAGMEWAVEEDADVISMSLGTPGGGFDPNLIEPVQNARAAGVFVIASAGNAGEGVTGSPGNVYESLSIGASNEARDIAQFSSGQVIDTDEAWGDAAPESWPETYINPDVSAPGVQVISTVPGDEYGPLSGTSMAAPHVAGVAALIQSADPSATPSEMASVLKNTAKKPDDAPDGKDVRYGTGIIDADAAVAAAVYDSGIEGTVTSNGDPVADAVVSIEDGPRATTDDNGTFSLTTGPGDKQLTVTGFGLAETTTNVTVEENQTTTVTIEAEPALDVELVEPQTSAVKAGTAAELVVDVANVEELTIDLTGNYSASNATLLVAGNEVPFGETLEFDGLTGQVPLAVQTAPNATGSFSLEHTFAGLGTEVTVTTGPTDVFAELLTVGVVDAQQTPQTTQTIEAVDAELSAQYVVEYVQSANATDAIGQYDSFVVQNFGDAETAGTFVEETNAAGVGVVLLDQWGDTSNAIPQVSEATGTPEQTAEGDLGTPPVDYQLEAAHPIVDDVGSAGDNVSIHEGTFADHSWFTNAEDATVLAAVGDQDGLAGDALAVDEVDNTVYASTLGRSSFVQNSDFTAAADTILGNAVEYVATNDGPDTEGAMTIEDEEIAIGGKANVTVGTTASGVAGYQATISFDPDTVQVTDVSGAEFSDPVVNVDNEAGTISIAQAQATAIDEPALAELTFESVGEGDLSAALEFDSEDSLVNDRDGETIRTTYEDGSLAVQSCAVGDVNEDGDVTAGDATLTQRHIVDDEIDGTFNEICADYDSDGEITAGDVIGILQQIVDA
jgi:subtilisin family serine protease